MRRQWHRGQSVSALCRHGAIRTRWDGACQAQAAVQARDGPVRRCAAVDHRKDHRPKHGRVRSDPRRLGPVHRLRVRRWQRSRHCSASSPLRSSPLFRTRAVAHSSGISSAERRMIGSISSIDGCGATQAQRSSPRQPRARSRSSSVTTSRPRSALPASVYTATPGGSISGVLRARLGWVKYS